ncbi:PaaI family thioesterase [Roseicella aquatilis]|uniref:Medium/long-chain acyl-CoA thioesterase YigI n=1 Tax=Roseicella aquatilis TaxID=2527868 RepID=A0A4R4DT85_9PROT|nr:PaaI family thioesterase [Roseicella aquatilis]TCZ65916.1 PaaI family thioesterase [Roseicella aquatilis]
MPSPAAPDPDYAARCAESFGRQAFLHFIGATVESVAPGRVVLRLPFRPELAQQHGFFHAGALTTLADTAAGYAAFSLMPAGAAVLTVEFKVNLLRPARGAVALARAEVIKPGRTLMAVRADVLCLRGEEEELVATMLATMMAVQGRPDVPPG